MVTFRPPVPRIPLNVELFIVSQVDPRTFFQETNDNKPDRIVTLRCCGVRDQGIPFGKPQICGELANVVPMIEPARLLLKRGHVSVDSTHQRLGYHPQGHHHVRAPFRLMVSWACHATDPVQTPSKFQHSRRTMARLNQPPNVRLNLYPLRLRSTRSNPQKPNSIFRTKLRPNAHTCLPVRNLNRFPRSQPVRELRSSACFGGRERGSIYLNI